MTAQPHIDVNALRPAIEDAAWFASARAEWDALVEHAGCDPLFNGWAWRSTWWAHFDGDPSAHLSVLVLRDASGRLCAALPLFGHVARLRGIRVCRVQLLGSAMGVVGDNEFSEYCDGCVLPGFERIAAEQFARLLLGMRWHELVSQCVRDDSWLACWLVPALARMGYQVRHSAEMQAWGVDLRQGVDAWRQSLSSNVRRRTIGQRGRLKAPVMVRIEHASLDDFIVELNALHVARWGRPVYSQRRVAFHRELLALLPCEALQASRLQTDGDTLSLLYNLRLDGRVYNLQSGFDSARASQLSPGYLHLGFAIEAAVADGAGYFDMLGGRGKVRDYKPDLGVLGSRMASLQVVRPAWLRWLYGAWDHFRR